MTTAAGSDLLHLLAGLDFDIEAGMALSGGDKAFYCDLIREFHSDVLPRRTSHLAGSCLEKRREYAHLLKGTLQVLGQRGASRKASDLERALRNGEPHDGLASSLLGDLDRMDGCLSAAFAGEGR